MFALCANFSRLGGRRAWPSWIAYATEAPAWWPPPANGIACDGQLFIVLVPIDGAGGPAHSLTDYCRQQTRFSGRWHHRRRTVLMCAPQPYSAGYGRTKIGQMVPS
jgi:hypothetical protein